VEASDGTVILGIDEAGRGAQIGPIVLAAVSLRAAGLASLARQDLRDSKGLTPARRQHLVDIVRQHAAWIDVEVRAAAIVDRYVDGRNRRRPLTLNVLEREMATALIKRAPASTAIIADGLALFGPLRRRFAALSALNHADESHPAVMAAALVAKAERDKQLDVIDRACGSLCGYIPRRGYPGADTTAWLTRYQRFFGALPVDVRVTWGHRLERRGRGGRQVQSGL
jgi:ribonuclease HII